MTNLSGRGAKTKRPGLNKCLAKIKAGDTLCA